VGPRTGLDFCRREKSLAHTANQTPYRPSRSPVATKRKQKQRIKERTDGQENEKRKIRRSNGEGTVRGKKEEKEQYEKWNTYCVACNRLQDSSVPTSSTRNFINFNFRSSEYS
jgi:hypothetical protein